MTYNCTKRVIILIHLFTVPYATSQTSSSIIPIKSAVHSHASNPIVLGDQIFLIVQKLSLLYLQSTKDEHELHSQKSNSEVLALWLEKALGGDRTALAAALKYIVAPLAYVEYENGFSITDDITTRDWLIKKLKRCDFSKQEIELFMQHFPHHSSYPINEFLKAYVVKNGLLLFDHYMKHLYSLETKEGNHETPPNRYKKSIIVKSMVVLSEPEQHQPHFALA